jgi:hypothetical protein
VHGCDIKCSAGSDNNVVLVCCNLCASYSVVYILFWFYSSGALYLVGTAGPRSYCSNGCISFHFNRDGYSDFVIYALWSRVLQPLSLFLNE